MVTIKRAISPQDLKSALEIQLSVFFEEQGIPEALCREGNDDAWHVLAFDGVQPVATARIRFRQADEGELGRVAVLPSYRSAGIGRDLILALEKTAIEKGLRRITLRPHRTLESFYSSLGYSRPDDWTEIVGGHDLIRMQKHLSC